MDNEACSQHESSNLTLQITSRSERATASKMDNESDWKQGALLRTYRSLGREKVCLRRHRASWVSRSERRSPIKRRLSIFASMSSFNVAWDSFVYNIMFFLSSFSVSVFWPCV